LGIADFGFRIAHHFKFAALKGAHSYWVWVLRTFAQVSNEPVGAQQ
jgi:hypothetical protein